MGCGRPSRHNRLDSTGNPNLAASGTPDHTLPPQQTFQPRPPQPTSVLPVPAPASSQPVAGVPITTITSLSQASPATSPAISPSTRHAPVMPTSSARVPGLPSPGPRPAAVTAAALLDVLAPTAAMMTMPAFSSESSIGPLLMSQPSAISTSSLLAPESGSSSGHFLQSAGRRVPPSQAYGSSFRSLPSTSNISLPFPEQLQLAPALGPSSSDLSSPSPGMTLQVLQGMQPQEVTSVTPDAGLAFVRSLDMPPQLSRRQPGPSSVVPQADGASTDDSTASPGSCGMLQPEMLQTLADLRQMGNFDEEQSLRDQVRPGN